ncbi:putative HTH-type transcriptional regulator [Powai lake megavirus]|uniref:Putative HTH-type transcriptional regulator n=1 Tax=Powai lake megavirus TaxID=1842663 RepID=A0A167RK25_9VIRU|nr:putative HTH-type transcriptional regulator [Powai lake megavirus]ANB50778.1 putative HTH-type transcriptional regulator [Powai lake megavirus]
MSQDHVMSIDDSDISEQFGINLSSNTKNNKMYVNPYKMKPQDVKLYHFKDARLFDNSIKSNDANWEVQRWYAKRKYNQWLKNVRRQEGWEGFRRPLIEITQEVEDEYGNIIILRKKVPYRKTLPREVVARQTSSNNSKYTPQSREKGVSVDDTNFRPRMFTEKMGREICMLRNSKKMTQAELAKQINVDANMIRNIEMGGLISFSSQDPMVRAMARVLGVPSIKYQE